MHFVEMLGRATIYRASEDSLLLVTARGEVLLSFARRLSLTMNPADLVGSRWVLDDFANRAIRSERPITLTFTDSTIAGFGGCRGYTGDYVANGDRIGFPSLTMLST